MSSERLYSTRELAQLWNVSETTIKRWTSSRGLNCIKTPGGHRRFSLHEIIRFQSSIGFQASGLLHGEKRGFPELEIWINSKDFAEIRRFVFLLALHNRVEEITEFLNRLYLRGISIAEFYDQILVGLEGQSVSGEGDLNLKGYRLNLVRSNLKSAAHIFYLNLDAGKINGRTALCVSMTEGSGIPLQIMSCIFKEEGWESLTLREPCDLKMLRDCVKQEPVNVLSVWLPENYVPDIDIDQREKLVKALKRYRIPVIVIQKRKGTRVFKEYFSEKTVEKFSDFQRQVRSIL